jgi:mannose-6-phosphate isomerase-like protein (cupin superfamily)
MPEYPRVQVDEVSDTPNPTAHKREIDEALGANAVGFNLYVARPGERLPWGYHYHPDHEELLYVLDGKLEIETDGRLDRESSFRVGAGEALLIPAGAPQCTRAVGESSARVIAVGAPKDADSAVIEEYCPACEKRTDRTYEPIEAEGEPIYVLSCTECGTETDRFGAGPD